MRVHTCVWIWLWMHQPDCDSLWFCYAPKWATENVSEVTNNMITEGHTAHCGLLVPLCQCGLWPFLSFRFVYWIGWTTKVKRVKDFHKANSKCTKWFHASSFFVKMRQKLQKCLWWWNGWWNSQQQIWSRHQRNRDSCRIELQRHLLDCVYCLLLQLKWTTSFCLLSHQFLISKKKRIVLILVLFQLSIFKTPKHEISYELKDKKKSLSQPKTMNLSQKNARQKVKGLKSLFSKR